MIYAIDADKNHRIVSKSSGFYALVNSYLDIGKAVVEADADGWISHDGKECPLPDGSRCDVKVNGCTFMDARVGGVFWRNVDAYRPILDTDTKPESPAWDGEGERPPVGSRCMKGHTRVLILAHANVGSPYNPAVVWQSLDEPGDIDWAVANVFSPIRSEEERAVEEMRAIIDACEAQSVDDRLRDLYRAGYRRTGGES